jgi:D-alanyl-D-alanine carboxypeptidase/D-alanyl-D-alanine-endopeptidase (penicillin-binding protein 4)
MAPRGGYLLLDSVSKPLALIVRDMNKYSNNFVAEQLVKTLAAEIAGAPGSTAKGMRVIANYLDQMGIKPGSYRLVNGSGLTRDNRISASALITVLANAFTDFRIAPEVMSSFSIAGVDGTTAKRQTSKKVKGLARAKTGTLSGVSTLVGAIPSETGEMIGYAILMNGNAIDWVSSHKIQDSMLNAMAGFTRR